MKRIIDKTRHMPETAKSSLAFIICSFITKGIVFLTTPIFTRIMSIDQYGIVATYNSWLSIIEVFAVLGLTSAGVFNVGLNDNKQNRDKYISICLGLCNVSTLLVFIILVIVKSFSVNIIVISDKMLIIMFIHFLFSPAQIFWMTRNRYEYKYKMVSIVTISMVFIAQILSICGILFLNNDTGYIRILCNEIGTLIFAIPIYIIMLKRGKDYVNLNEWKKILVLALPLIPHYLSQHVMASADKIMINNMIGSSDVSIYSIVANIGMIGTIFWSAINASLVPYTFEKINEKKYNDINNVAKKLVIGYLAICMVVILLAPEILKILAPAKYYSGIYAVPPITIVVFLQSLYNLFANVEFYYKRTKLIAVSTVIATIVNIILNYIFIPKYSYVAAAYTTLTSYVVLVIMHYIGYKLSTKEKIYDSNYLLKLCVILLVFSVVSILIYNLNIIIRYSLIIIMLIILIYNRKKIINTIKLIR